jgi:hypothetical protein
MVFMTERSEIYTFVLARVLSLNPPSTDGKGRFLLQVYQGREPGQDEQKIPLREGIGRTVTRTVTELVGDNSKIQYNELTDRIMTVPVAHSRPYLNFMNKKGVALVSGADERELVELHNALSSKCKYSEPLIESRLMIRTGRGKKI